MLPADKTDEQCAHCPPAGMNSQKSAGTSAKIERPTLVRLAGSKQKQQKFILNWTSIILRRLPLLNVRWLTLGSLEFCRNSYPIFHGIWATKWEVEKKKLSRHVWPGDGHSDHDLRSAVFAYWALCFAHRIFIDGATFWLEPALSNGRDNLVLPLSFSWP